MTEENKGYPEGSVKTVITELDSIKMNAKIGFGATGRGVKIVYEDAEYGAKDVKLPEGKFKGKALEVPTNKKLLKQLEEAIEAYDEDDEQKFTLTFVKGEQYWDFQGIEAGEHGTQGVVKPGQESSSGGNSGGTYNPAGAIIGKIENWALEITIANKTAKGKVTLEGVLETLEDFDEELISKINQAATNVYNVAFGKGADKTPAKEDTPKQASKEDLEDEDIDEDDVPF